MSGLNNVDILIGEHELHKIIEHKLGNPKLKNRLSHLSDNEFSTAVTLIALHRFLTERSITPQFQVALPTQLELPGALNDD